MNEIGRRGTAKTGVPPHTPTLAPLARRSVPRDPVALARWLIGKRLVRQLGAGMVGGRIVETEAYLPDDPASHSFAGLTARNRAMFNRRGHAYVYQIYGMWFCFNISAGDEGEGAAVLIRALHLEWGVNDISKRRMGVAARDLTRGPGRLCAALEIDRTLDGVDLCTSNGALWLAQGDGARVELGVSARIGLSKAVDAPLRFYERGHACVSGPKRLQA